MIAVQFILFAITLINLSWTILAATLFEWIGHAILRVLGLPGFNLSLVSSLKVGAVGGAIIAIPFNIGYALLQSYLSPQIKSSQTLGHTQGRSEQDEQERGESVPESEERRPLLSASNQSNRSDRGDGRHDSFQYQARAFNDSLKRTQIGRNPFDQRLRTSQASIAPQSSRRTWIAVIGDFGSGPLLVALAGAVGSFVLGKTGHEVLSVLHATEAGALGGAFTLLITLNRV